MAPDELALSYGWDGGRLPWFGLFVADNIALTIRIITNYKSEEAISIALEEGSERWPGRSFIVYWNDDEMATAGFIPS